MKKITVLSVALLAVGLAAFAETETSAKIENVVVRQRWPWKGVVDIDFTVRGKATGVKFVAKYDGVEPFTLAEKDLSGEFAEILEPGIHSVTWNPEKAGLDKTELKNFSVSVVPLLQLPLCAANLICRSVLNVWVLPVQSLTRI